MGNKSKDIINETKKVDEMEQEYDKYKKENSVD
jgi:hypothetical protein